MNRKQLVFLLTLVLLLGVILTAAYVTFSARIAGLEEKLDDFSASVSRELEDQHGLSQRMLRNQRTLTRHLQETREVLNLPAGQYSFPDNSPRESGENRGGGSAEDSAFFRAVDEINRYYARKELEQELHRFLEERRDELLPLAEMGAELQERESSSYAIVTEGFPLCTVAGLIGDGDGKPAVRVTCYDGEKRRFELETAIERSEGTRRPDYRLADKSAESLRRFINRKSEEFRSDYQHFAERKRALREMIGGEGVEQALEEKDLTIDRETEGYGKITYVLRPKGEQEHLSSFGTAVSSGKYTFNGGELSSLEELRSRLAERIEEVDARSQEEKQVARAKKRVLKVAEDPAFRAYLKQNGLRLSAEPRKGRDYYYFDLLQKDGSRFGSFAVLKKIGEIYLADHEDVIITSLKSLHKDPLSETRSAGPAAGGEITEEDLPEEIPERYSKKLHGGDGITTVLLCGTHQNNADAIMLARMEKGEGISLLSIPRDLYYQERKLGSYFRIYGVSRFRELLSTITGVQIDGHVVVDMYAFIDIVDILGGLNVTLQKPLIDPTYKVRDHGEWRTLYFEAGTHHLSGIEALRVARSRHTSDDFERAHRQQLILEALRRKISRLHAGNLEKVYKIFRTITDYIASDFTPYELAQLYLSYRSTDITETTGLSTENVLYATYSKIYHRDLTGSEVSADVDKGAWILLPKENDWQLIKWYTHKTFEEL